MSIKSHLKGAVRGFITGGVTGALSGAVMGNVPGSNPNMSKRGRSIAGALSGSILPTTGTFSGSQFVRYAANPATSPVPSAGFNWNPQGPMSSLGFTAMPPSTAVGGASGAPGWAYRRLYTKRGTPRRIRRDGQPYAVPRMNPMNPRAARRAIRRVRGARRLLQRIERSLPKQTVHRRRAPAAR